jgi:hypothetical protein
MANVECQMSKECRGGGASLVEILSAGSFTAEAQWRKDRSENAALIFAIYFASSRLGACPECSEGVNSINTWSLSSEASLRQSLF